MNPEPASRLKYKAPRMLTYRQAAAETDRSLRAIHRWRRAGMPMGWRIKDGQKVRVVREDVLMAWKRDRLRNNPAHQYRMRKLMKEQDTE
jgi:hypothetical protein